jgi:hypothetical protein
VNGRLHAIDFAGALLKRAEAEVRGYCPHAPFAKQAEFLALDCEEAFYGGAGGGGKSDALLMAALRYVDVPGYSALLLRRTFKALNEPDAIMARADEWLRGTDARWIPDEKEWRFPSGAKLGFGYFDTVRDRDNYQGGAYQFIGWDELTQFPSSFYTYLFSRLRKPASGALSLVPLRMRGAGNPGGIGHEWVFRRFVNPDTARAPFVPARAADNPHIDQESYLKTLALADSLTQQQIRDGVWVRDASGLVYAYDSARNDGERPEPKSRAWVYVLGLDFGVRDDSALSVLAYRDHDPCVYGVESFRMQDTTADDVARAVLALPYTFSKIVGDVGGLGKAFAEDMRRRFSIPVEPAEKTNKLGFISLLNGALERSVVRVDQRRCAALTREWSELPWSDDSRQKEAPGFDNHASDSFLYAWRACPNYHEREIEKKPKDEEVKEQMHDYFAGRAERSAAAAWFLPKEDHERGPL